MRCPQVQRNAKARRRVFCFSMRKVDDFVRLIALVGAMLFGSAVAQAGPMITELMASNGSTIADQNGDYADWLEIYNPDPVSVDLTGWYLTNKAGNLTKWTMPSVTLKPGATLVIFCSSKDNADPTQPMATNFNLSDSGGFVALVAKDGRTIVSSITFPAQYLDVSYGVSLPKSSGETAQTGYFLAPTPGVANGDLTSILLPERVTINGAPGLFTGTKTVSLSGAVGTEQIRYVLAGASPAGAGAAAPTASSPVYTGPITVDSTVLLRAAVFSADGTRRGLVSSAMYVEVDTTTSNRLDTFSTAMPVVVFENNGLGLLKPDDAYYPGWIGAFSPKSGTTSLLQKPDFFIPDMTKLHGSSSATWPKQSYNINLTDDLGNDVSQKFLGLDNSKSWVTIASWYYDRTYIHNAFVYSLSRALGYWAPATKSVEMFIHSEGGTLDATSYGGIVTLTDRIKVAKDRVNIYEISTSDVAAPGVTGGYILKVDHPDVGEYAWMTSRGVSLSLEIPKPDELMSEQASYITDYVQKMENAMVSDHESNYAARTYLSYLDRPSWVDYHLLNVFVENDDAFQSSEYFTKDVDGLIKAGPVWDYDRSMGSSDGRDMDPFRWTPLNEADDYWDIGWWKHLTHDPDFMQLWIDRWQSLRLSTLSDTSLLNRVDAVAAQIDPAAAARDAARWEANVSRYGDWAGEVAHMKTWLISRAQWIDARFVAAPTLTVSSSEVTLTPAPGTSIVYTLNGVDPRRSGGDMAPGTYVTDHAVSLALGEVVFARSYDAAQATAYPGSPWSSAVNYSGEKTGQLANVSCRTMVGTGGDVLVAGFVISGPADETQQVLVRGVGPELASYSVQGALAEPVLSIYNQKAELVATNRGWSNNGNAGLIEKTGREIGAFGLPHDSADSALMLSLRPGVYSAQVAGSDLTTGNGLVEVYPIGGAHTFVTNVSSRALVNASTGPLIAGFVITGGPAQVLVRGIGPALLNYGVGKAVAQPILEVFDAAGTLIATNRGWSSASNATDVAAAAAVVGAFPLASGSPDSALLLTLPAGVYSIHVVAGSNETGSALAECYLVPAD